MGTIVIRCPNTGEMVETSIFADDRSFETLPSVEATPFRCSACGELHRWNTDQTALVKTEAHSKCVRR